MKGYIIDVGYMGYIPNKGYTLFTTEEEYREEYRETENEENE